MAAKPYFACLLFLTIYGVCFLCYGSAIGHNSDEIKMIEDIGKSIPNKCFTLPAIEDMFMRACEKILNSHTQCSYACSAFTLAFSYKDPNMVAENDYKLFFDIIPVETHLNAVVYWSGVRSIAEQISTYPNISTSTNHASSRIINTMENDGNVKCWCANTTAFLDTINPCPVTPLVAFWRAFYSRYGELGIGIVYWIGDGNREGGAYQNATFFSDFEFPQLKYPRVYRMVALVIYDCNATKSEKCGEGTLKVFEDHAVKKYGSYRCENVCGDISDEKQIPSLADQCLEIIRAEEERGTYVY